jgi:hypothetical protein
VGVVYCIQGSDLALLPEAQRVDAVGRKALDRASPRDLASKRFSFLDKVPMSDAKKTIYGAACAQYRKFQLEQAERPKVSHLGSEAAFFRPQQLSAHQMGLPLSLLQAQKKQNFWVGTKPGFYDYEPFCQGSDEIDVWVDFANRRLGGGCFCEGMVQEETMVGEMPDFAELIAEAKLRQINTIHAGLSLAQSKMKRDVNGRALMMVHSGKLGCGAFGNDYRLNYLLHSYAAMNLGMSVLLHGYTQSEVQECEALWQQIHPLLGQGGERSLADGVGIIVKQCYESLVSRTR